MSLFINNEHYGPRCSGMTRKGTACKNPVSREGMVCWLHEENEIEEDGWEPEIEEDPEWKAEKEEIEEDGWEPEIEEDPEWKPENEEEGIEYWE